MAARLLQLVVGLLATLTVARAEPLPSLLIVASDRSAPYEEALAGVRQQLGEGRYAITVRYLGEVGEPPLWEVPPSLIIALGGAAARRLAGEGGEIPAMACLIYPRPPGEFPLPTAVSLEFPFEAYFVALRRLVPDARNVGLLYNPAENGQRAAEARRVAERYGINLVAYRVEGPNELPSALDRLAERVEVLLGLPDGIVFTPSTAKQLLLFSYRNRIPLVGLSESWVRAGGLFSLDWDFEELGRQCGEKVPAAIARRRINPAYPKRISIVANRRTVQHMKLERTDEWAAADLRYVEVP